MAELPPPELDTVRAALTWGIPRLEQAGVPGSRLDAELLLAEVLGVQRMRLTVEPGRRVSQDEAVCFRGLIARRADREPLQYILGRQEFWSLDFEVGPDVLIPRPETELLVEMAIEAVRGRFPRPLCVDMGCGSGTIATVLARELRAARVVAVDLSPQAAARTRRATVYHGVSERVSVLCADLFSALARGGRVDVVVSNPPYIDRQELDGLQPEVARFEPRVALDGGVGGLAIIERLLDGAAGCLASGGLMIFEAGWDQAERIGLLVAGKGVWRSHRIRPDLAGHPRVHLLEKA